MCSPTAPRKKEAEITGRTPPEHKTENDIRKGFVYTTVPHISSSTVANTPEIDTIHAKWQERLEPLRRHLNAALGKCWEEWQIPREPQDDWANDLKASLAKWWDLRRQRQAEIDASISRNAGIELLYDQPHEDGKRIRVAGPFTVESLSPHEGLRRAAVSGAS